LFNAETHRVRLFLDQIVNHFLGKVQLIRQHHHRQQLHAQVDFLLCRPGRRGSRQFLEAIGLCLLAGQQAQGFRAANFDGIPEFPRRFANRFQCGVPFLPFRLNQREAQTGRQAGRFFKLLANILLGLVKMLHRNKHRTPQADDFLVRHAAGVQLREKCIDRVPIGALRIAARHLGDQQSGHQQSRGGGEFVVGDDGPKFLHGLVRSAGCVQRLCQRFAGLHPKRLDIQRPAERADLPIVLPHLPVTDGLFVVDDPRHVRMRRQFRLNGLEFIERRFPSPPRHQNPPGKGLPEQGRHFILVAG
jgi:hypothetical protein